MPNFSPKQIESYIKSTKRLNFWEGSVRSGKTFMSIIRLIRAIQAGPEGDAMIIGVSRESLQRNILSEMCPLMGIPIPTPKTTQIKLFNRTVYLVGANDERAQNRIRGSTLAIAYVDEATLIPKSFFRMLLSRLSKPGAQLFATTNPDSPFHWLKQEFLDNPELDKTMFKFRLSDNPSLTESFITELKKEYQGLWYKRYIDGEWVLAEGTVYDFFDEELHVIATPPGPAKYYIVGVDYGTSNPTTFSLIGYNPRYFPNAWMEKEYHYDSKKLNRQKTDTEYAEDLVAFIKGYNVEAIYIDPSALSFKNEMFRQGVSSIADADNDVLNGIRFTSQLLSNGTFKVCSNCRNAVREFQTYRWDSKVSERGEDKPIKEFDHQLDGLRYALYTHLKAELGDSVTSDDLDREYNKVMGVQQELPAFFQDPIEPSHALSGSFF
jgi:PBSX family phage terminase large subunit